MLKSLMFKSFLPLMVPATLAIGSWAAIAQTAVAQTASSQSSLYRPIPMPSSNEVSDSITDQDIPTGFGGFARDYLVDFKEGDQVVIDLTSDQFDTILTLIAPDGSTVAENDDGPDGTTNSLLFARVTRPGNYIVRVSPYAGQGVGAFTLKVTKLRPI
ncbi:PPC domain-containing protein [Leptolyngbya sp. GB1-A1]